VSNKEHWSVDAEVLLEIGRCIEAQGLSPLSVRLPRRLVTAAIAAWERDDDGEELGPETPDERRIRHRAAGASLMGLEFTQQEVVSDAEVVVAIQPHLIGDALRAAWGED
jgi:hypothetical protein